MKNAYVVREELVSLGGFTVSYTSVNGEYYVQNYDYLVDCVSGTFSVFLPDASGLDGRILIIKNSGLGTITIVPFYAQNIDGSTSKTLGSLESLQIQGNGSNWVIVSSGAGGTGAGPAGPAGPRGATGPTGPSGGPLGPTGPTGAQGPAGSNGATGPAGSNGATGPTGAQGPAGSSGATGPAGATGTQGPAGSNGPTGATGSQGPAGSNGATGPTGSQGSQGIPGSTGPTGPTGSQGIQGTTGSTGPTGSTGANFTYSVTGPNPPSNPNVGDRWYDTTQGTEFVYINDGNSSQWVTPVVAPQGPTLFLTQAIDQSTATLSFDFVYYGVTYTGGICSIDLPLGNSSTDGRFVIVADEVGNISYGNRGILVQGQNSQPINGEDSVLMKIDRMSLTFLYRNNSWKTI
jgi:hypothetical protein